MENSGGPLDNQTWQTELRTAPLTKVQLCEYDNQTLEAYAVASRLYTESDCPVSRQNASLLTTAHDCETGLLKVNNQIRSEVATVRPEVVRLKYSGYTVHMQLFLYLWISFNIFSMTLFNITIIWTMITSLSLSLVD